MRVFDQERSELQEALLSMRRIFVVVGVFSFFINGLMLVKASASISSRRTRLTCRKRFSASLVTASSMPARLHAA